MPQFFKIGYLFLTYFLIVGLNTVAQKIDVAEYENKAQAYAILSAQYSKDAYYYSRNSYFNSNMAEVKLNCDTGITCVELAMEYADSAFDASFDTCEYARTIMLYAKDNQQKAIEGFYQIKETNDVGIIHRAKGKTMYATGNAIVDAYQASLAFDWKEMSDSSERRGGAMYSASRDVKEDEPIIEDHGRDVTRLESDEFSYMTVKELYGKRLVEIDDELILLRAEAVRSSGKKLEEIKEAITQLLEEEKEVFEKMKNSEDKLINVKTDLSEEMLHLVNKDIFTTEKKGFYNEKVPVPVNAEMPMGLVYRVQIGFFKSQLPPEHFDGVFPISSQKVDNTYYRYAAGNFAKYEEAKEAKTMMREKGYKDSFVVAYIDKVKVSINEALKKEKEMK